MMKSITSLKARSRLIVLLLLASLLSTCAAPAPLAPTQSYSADVATAWFDLYLDLVQNTQGFTPPIASRAFGYAGVTLYEAVVPGMAAYQSLAGQLNDLAPLPQPETGSEYHWPTVANSALADIARKLFANATPENLATIDALESRFADEFKSKLDPAAFERSAVQGRAVASAIVSWSMSDGGHEGYAKNFPTDYAPPAGPGLWSPTPPGFLSAMQPRWGDNRPFVLKSGSECAVDAPPPYSEDSASEFYRQALEVRDLVSSLTPDHETIALFWADDPGRTPTPAGHSISIATQVLKQKNASLAEAAETYAKAGMAVADSFIACWNTKYQHNLMRPITYIQSVIDADWTSLITTPPFPEYTSGHSVQSSAVAQVLTGLFDDNVAFTDHTHDERGLAPRSFASFFAAAEEAAISRLYGGIHYRAAIEEGLEQGKCIGEKINAVKFKK